MAEEPKILLEESILISMMKRIGVNSADYGETSYAEDMLQAINGAIVALVQTGVGPAEGFRVENELATWEDFLGDSLLFETAKDYIFSKCKLRFDPPPAAAIESMTAMSKEDLWRSGLSAEFLVT